MDRVSDQSESPRRTWGDRFAVGLATGLGAGFAPGAPGSVGAAVWGLPFAWLIGQLPLAGQCAAIVGLAVVGVPVCTRAARALGDSKDPGSIVWDEIVSMPITFLMIPMVDPLTITAGYAFNRVFDILKPPPIRHLEKLPDGLGVMADDWAAGAYSAVVMHLLIALNLITVAGVGSP